MREIRMGLSVGELTLAHFAELSDRTFRVDGGPAGPVVLELINASGLGTQGRKGTARREAFSLIFRGPLHSFLDQRIYRFEHESLGALEIFIVPLGPDEQGHIYEAIFT